MNEVSFQSFLTQNSQLDEEYVASELTRLSSKITRKFLPKGTFVIQPGTICTQSFFVEKGLLRYYSLDEKGKEHILHFATEGWILSDRESVYFHQPSSYLAETLEDSELLFIEKDFFTLFNQDGLQAQLMNERLLQNHIRHLQKRITQLLSATAEERYLDFVSLYPNVLTRVPQWMVASYLGITPESLSRVRKDLANKWKENQ